MENKKCSKCKYLDMYYTKGVKHFSQTDFGWCRCRKESVNVRDCRCDLYEVQKNVGRIDRRVKVNLNDMLTEIQKKSMTFLHKDLTPFKTTLML